MTIYQYPQNLGDVEAQPASIQFQWYTRKVIDASVPGDTVILYMPQEAHQPSTTSWDQESFGALGRFAYDKSRGIKGPTLAQLGEKTAGFLALSVADHVVGKLGGKATGTDIASASLAKLMNPYLTMVFRGVDMRKFSFQFKFSPFHPSDANKIFDIVQSFRKNSLPTNSSSSVMLGYPSECEIQYLWQGTPNPYLNQFKRCVCTKVDVNYTGQGVFAAMRDGFPASIIMDVDFTELDIVTAHDIKYSTNIGSGQSY